MFNYVTIKRGSAAGSNIGKYLHKSSLKFFLLSIGVDRAEHGLPAVCKRLFSIRSHRLPVPLRIEFFEPARGPRGPGWAQAASQLCQPSIRLGSARQKRTRTRLFLTFDVGFINADFLQLNLKGSSCSSFQVRQDHCEMQVEYHQM